MRLGSASFASSADFWPIADRVISPVCASRPVCASQSRVWALRDSRLGWSVCELPNETYSNGSQTEVFHGLHFHGSWQIMLTCKPEAASPIIRAMGELVFPHELIICADLTALSPFYTNKSR